MGSARGREDGAPGTEPVAAADAHEHRWAGSEFTFEDDHPWFRMRCACGAERTIRAWERYSDPDAEPPTDEPMTAAEG
jgi:hypothetical protein